jgi:O-acetyl-ADP-ribose deacetylase (regulator of RNase III)
MKQQADAEGLSTIAMPRIGVRYGGLSWKRVWSIIEAVLADWHATLVVYQEFARGDVVRP